MSATILLVDDESLLRASMRESLEFAGHRVQEAEDGKEGLKKLEQSQIDLLITDVIMPNKDGMELLLEVVRRWPTLPVLAISGGSRVITSRFTLGGMHISGAWDTLPKPFKNSELLAKVRTLLARAKARSDKEEMLWKTPQGKR